MNSGEKLETDEKLNTLEGTELELQSLGGREFQGDGAGAGRGPVGITSRDRE